MHPDPSDTPHPTPDTLTAPVRHRFSDATWDLARRDYLAGDPAGRVCDRYGMSRSALHERARRRLWRKGDQPEPPPVPDDPLEGETPLDLDVLAEQALVRVGQALQRGRAAEAASWMRTHDRLVARIATLNAARDEARAAGARRCGRVAAALGSDGADDPLIAALRPLRQRMALINSLGAAQLRVSRAWRHKMISTEAFHRFNALHSGVAEGYERMIGVSAASPDGGSGDACAPAPGQPDSPDPEFSAAPDP
ncbi:hypothetical protein [Brevundimonas sp. FT23042]|uniref:hypothetical protein n=1 Tax=Brevundimonas sp. FT23042 TaxID=3393749 RepID=UPI003B587C21